MDEAGQSSIGVDGESGGRTGSKIGTREPGGYAGN